MSEQRRGHVGTCRRHSGGGGGTADALALSRAVHSRSRGEVRVEKGDGENVTKGVGARLAYAASLCRADV